MSRAGAQDLTSYLQKNVGDYLRSVVFYEETDHELLFIRDDVAAEYSEDEIEDVVEDLFFEAFGAVKQEEMYQHGGLRCVIRCFDEAVELHFPHGETAGTAAALEPAAAMDAYGFVGDCLDQLYGDYPPE